MKVIRKGQIWVPVLGGTPIEIIKAIKPEGYWQTRKVNGSSHSHRIHFGTLRKFYKLEEN